MKEDLDRRWRDLGEFIREQRNVGQMSLRKLSEAAGVSNPYLSQIERGLRRPSAEILQQIARALEISSETLYVRAGILDEPAERVDPIAEIRRDPTITEEQKKTLVRIYQSFRRENELDALDAEDAATDPSAAPASDDDPAQDAPDVAVVSMHTSPLVQPGTGDSGGMNVYVRELSASLAQAGVDVRVYVRRWADDLPERVSVEPGFEVVHVSAGSPQLAKEDLPAVVDEFTEGVAADLAVAPVQALHANYWLSAVSAHDLKHRLDLPLVATFHTLARVKAEAGDLEPLAREAAEAMVIGCCDAICASNPVEADQLVQLYGARPERIELVPSGVDHAFFSPGDRTGARTALGLDDRPTLLFVGRIQPLKGLTVAVEALAQLEDRSSRLVVVGGPSGTEGPAEMARVMDRIEHLGLADRVTFVAPQPHHMLSTWYRAADVVVVPSRSESFGLVALEAAACGVPVVASAVGGLRTLVDSGVTGTLVDDRDPAAWARAIDAILADPQKAAWMGAAAAEASRRYSWSTTAGRLRRLYADLAVRTPVACA